MELQQLRYFLEVAESQHITRSAEKLHIAQPALSQCIHRLESEVGVSLFDHRGRNIALTPCGEYLKERLTPLIAELDALPDRVQAIAEAGRKTVRLNVLAASTLVIEAVAEYKKICGDVNFKLLQNDESDDYDIGVFTSRHYRAGCGADERRVLTEQILLAVPANATHAKSASLSDFRNAPFISLSGSKILRQICDRICEQAGFAPNLIFESDSPSAVRDMIAENMGVGFWPEFSWGHIGGDRVRLLEITDPPCHREILLTRRGAEDDTAAAEFYRYLTEFFAKKKRNA